MRHHSHHRNFAGPSGSNEAWNRSNLFFARQRSDRTPLEKERPLTGWSSDLAAGVGIIIFIYAVFVGLPFVVGDLGFIRDYLGL